MGDRISLNSRAIYSIQLQGILDQKWADQFGHLEVHTSHAKKTDHPPISTIVGEMADQAALAGFLSLVYSLGLPLLSVTYLGRP